MKRKGVTILEIVVVMTILLVLAAIIFPIFKQSKERAKETVCVSNVRQLLAAVELYANDNDGKYPWTSSALSPEITKYTGGVRLQCYVRSGTSQERGDYLIAAARHPEPDFYGEPNPRFPQQYDECRNKRGGEFPMVLDVNHVSKMQRATASRSVCFVGRADGSVRTVMNPIEKLTPNNKSLPCAFSLYWLNL